MQRVLCAAVSICLLLASSLTAAEKLPSGLVGEYFLLPQKLGEADQPPASLKPFFVRVDGQVNFPEAGQEFYGTKLADNFCVRWTGVLRIEQAGKYSFHTSSDDGSRLYIDGKLVVENWGPHGMTKKSGEIELEAGDHDIRIAYEEISGSAGCIVGWTPPSGKEEVVPASVLFHRPPQANITWDEKAWKKVQIAKNKSKPGGDGVEFDRAKFGPFVGAALHLGEDEHGANVVHRGIIIRLEEQGDACVVFDADTMRMASGWTDGGLTRGGLPVTGKHGQFPYHNGPLAFRTAAAPGWSHNGQLDDPREGDYPPLGPLPKDWAHYEGLYLHGDQVVLSYTVGEAKVLEAPSLAIEQEQRLIQRNLQIESAAKPLTMVLADIEDENTIDGRTARLVNTEKNRITLVGVMHPNQDAKLAIENGQLLLHLPAEDQQSFHIRFWRGDAAGEKLVRSAMTGGQTMELTPLTKGGPARWGEALVTAGELSSEENSPYVVDRVSVPYKNPFGSEMRIGGGDFLIGSASARESA